MKIPYSVRSFPSLPPGSELSCVVPFPNHPELRPLPKSKSARAEAFRIACAAFFGGFPLDGQGVQVLQAAFTSQRET